jgi:hypothetical protein
MMRWLTIALTLVLAISRSAAQDMPLSQILIDGEGWHEVSRDPDIYYSEMPRDPGFPTSTCRVRSPDGGTLYVGSSVGKYIQAFRIEKDGSRTAGQPYCSLRVPRGQKDMPVTDLCVDAAGRIYAATPIGVQIFDPTGRLCGVLNPKREPVMWVRMVDDVMFIGTPTAFYSRKVNAHGVAPEKSK